MFFFATAACKPGPWYNPFIAYKSLSGPAGEQPRTMLAAALSGGADEHIQSLISTLGGPPTIVTPVPSTRGKPYAEQPLRTVIERVRSLADVLSPALGHSGVERQRRRYQPGLFTATRSLADERVLLIEDLFTTGSTSTSAWHACASAGAAVAVLVIARELNLEWMPTETASVIRALGKPAWWDAPDA